MPDPARLRDSTQIVLPRSALSGLGEQLEAEFPVTLFSEGGRRVRIIGSPVVIKDVTEFLVRNGVALP
ncbi:VNG_1110C family protein [Natronorarus salvus]|uniref:VNG_1110C family protein n=1 Tax=Natronorarus salvus TaxID=3117733 RepID=UPI002F26B011